MAKLEIRPAKVSLSSRQAQIFEAILDETPVKDAVWSVEKGDGKIDKLGVYRSPWGVFRSRTVVISAAIPAGTPAAGTPAAGAEGRAATATIELTPIGFWTQFLGVYWFVCLAALAIFVTSCWTRLCPTCTVMVSPPIVTLSSGQMQVFTATVPVSWAPLDAANGVFRAPAAISAEQRVAITAASKADPEETATADVFLTSDFSFSLEPASATIAAGGAVDLTPILSPREDNEIEWPRPAAGRIAVREGSRSGGVVFRAPKEVSRPTTVLILARATGKRAGAAGAHVTILPSGSHWANDACDSRTATGLLILIAAMGAVGGLIHGISSFTTYVGNRELLSSWIWWYVFKPFLAALVAVVVYLVFRGGIGTGDFALSAADCLTSAAFAALIGLFAEPATLKLKDIFDTIFTPKADPRGDATGKAKPAVLEKLDPASLAVDATPLPELKVTGTGFLKDAQVKVGDAFRSTKFVSATELTVSLTADDVKKAQTLAVTAFNKPDGAPSNALTLTVK